MHAFGKENVDYVCCDYREINQKVEEFIDVKGYEEYDKVFITDISVDEEVAEKINDLKKSNKFILFDHHPTAEFLNKYEWATVTPTAINPHIGPIKTCGTTLLYEYLSNGFYSAHLSMKHIIDLAIFASTVRSWDVWDWKETNNHRAKRLNNLVYLIGRKKFIDRFADNLEFFNDLETYLLDIEDDRIKKYIDKVDKTIVAHKIKGYNAGVVFAESYVSELGNKLAEDHPEYDFIAIINPISKTVSFRGVKEEIDLGVQVASLYGGGGHPKAAGARIGDGIVERLIGDIFKME